jgi:hypothetical protein
VALRSVLHSPCRPVRRFAALLAKLYSSLRLKSRRNPRGSDPVHGALEWPMTARHADKMINRFAAAGEWMMTMTTMIETIAPDDAGAAATSQTLAWWLG